MYRFCVFGSLLFCACFENRISCLGKQHTRSSTNNKQQNSTATRNMRNDTEKEKLTKSAKQSTESDWRRSDREREKKTHIHKTHIWMGVITITGFNNNIFLFCHYLISALSIADFSFCTRLKTFFSPFPLFPVVCTCGWCSFVFLFIFFVGYNIQIGRGTRNSVQSEIVIVAHW